MASKYSSSPINQVRVAAGKTGEEFAATLNISVGAIRNLERGILTVSDITAEKLLVVYGVAPESVRQKKGQALSLVTNAPYDRNAYTEWLRLTALDDEKTQKIIEEQLKRLRWLLEAAAMNGSLFGVDYQLYCALDKIAQQGQLDGLIRTRLRQAGGKEMWHNLDPGGVGVLEYVRARLESDRSIPQSG